MVVSERGAIFKEKISLFLSKWPMEKGLTKLCIVFEGMYE